MFILIRTQSAPYRKTNPSGGRAGFFQENTVLHMDKNIVIQAGKPLLLLPSVTFQQGIEIENGQIKRKGFLLGIFWLRSGIMLSF